MATRRIEPSIWPAVAWGVLIAVLLLAPGSAAPASPWLERFAAAGGDKLIHGVLFLVQAVLLERALRRGSGAGRVWVAALLALLYGLALEGVQELVPGRGWEWKDLVADGVGAALWPLLRVWRRR